MANSVLDASRALTVAAELDGDGELGKLRETLAIIDGDIDGKNHERPHPTRVGGVEATNTVFRPGQLPDTHFMRFVIVEDPHHQLPTLLIWECNHDGDRKTYLRKVQKAAQDPNAILDFDRVFGTCVGYPKLSSGEAWVSWMNRRSYRAEAFYSGYRGIPKVKVDEAIRVHEAIRTLLDERRDDFAAKSPAEIHAALRAQLGALAPAAAETKAAFKRQKTILIVLLVLALPILLPLAVVALLLIPYLLFREHRDKPFKIARAVHAPPDLIAAEDRIVQNQLTHIVDLKPGLFRYVVQRVALFVIDQLARVHYVNGHLGGITSIHFARWVILPDPRWWRLWWWRRDRLIFFSNYDFSWDSYLGEFVDRQATGLTGVWSNTKGFPKTKLLVYEGATDEERFKQWARSHQIKTQVWWSGVRHSSVASVNNDVAVHRGIANPALAPRDAERWVRLL